MLLTKHLHKNFTTKYKLQVVKGRLKKKKSDILAKKKK